MARCENCGRRKTKALEFEKVRELSGEEKEKDNQFLKKMYLSEKQKNDNYHTEKYALDKPVEELRKIKLTPKEKEIYYKGFDNCERQFATHIAELQQQLKEKSVDLSLARNEIDTLKGNLAISLEHKKVIEEQYLEKCKELKSQPAEIVEKIKETAIIDDEEYRIEPNLYKITEEELDTILKEYKNATAKNI